ncbi:hypothetical protein [Fulvivirga ligni]|uniref:hypothetical protein n=1 Tax=Fulvivirga ligni TaxID=2904246 RepID=UPI001F303B05|nr:hypothetical protein [Fulvivirga ligni]UII20371.1 hypothetical protein LVD16_21245 [Fulvivirga ligni]
MLRYINLFFWSFIVILLSGCEDENLPDDEICNDQAPLAITARNFDMGFTSWSYGPDEAEVENTYDFIENHGDIYVEQLDYRIPWNAWRNDTALPKEFTDLVSYKVSHKPSGKKLMLAVSLLNADRTDVIEDYDGLVPDYESVNDLESAYYKHLKYVIDEFGPDYLVMAMELNELYDESAPAMWNDSKQMLQAVYSNLKMDFPNLPISVSITLHNWYLPDDVSDKATYVADVESFVNGFDFAAISFYAFMKGLHEEAEFQQAFDFLHDHTSVPVAISETAYLAETLEIESYNLTILADECEQYQYLKTLLKNATDHNYLFTIWWAHRDFDKLWETFPEEAKDLGKIWRDTGLLDENGNLRPAFELWQKVYNL